jgi:hypothetical protein
MYNIVLDVDETLLHTYDEHGDDTSDIYDPFKIKVDGETLYGSLRPGLKEFLMKLKKNKKFNIGIWSAGSDNYVKAIAKMLEKKYNIKFDFVWTRKNCEYSISHDGYKLHKKPLKKLFQEYPHMNYTNTIIIDDRDDVCEDDLLNNILIPKYDIEDNPDIYKNDKYLIKIYNILNILDDEGVRYLNTTIT